MTDTKQGNVRIILLDIKISLCKIYIVKSKYTILLIPAVLLIFGAYSFFSSANKLTQEKIPLIPRTLLFGNPEKSQVRLSPDGSKISFLADVKGVANIWVGPADKPELAKPVTDDSGRGINTYKWAYTSKHILYLRDNKGDENWKLYAVEVSSKRSKLLTPPDKVVAQIQQVSDKSPNEILVIMNDRDPQLFDMYSINILTGEKSLVLKNEDGFIGFTTDDDYQVRFAAKQRNDGGFEILEKEKDSWKQFAVINPEDALTTDLLGIDKSGNILYMKDSRGKNTAVLKAIDIKTNKMKVLAEDPLADLDSVLIHPVNNNVQAATFIYDRQKWTVLDDSIKPDFDYLKTLEEGEMLILSRSLDDKKWLIAYSMDTGPYEYYLYDRENKNAQFLFNSRPKLEKYTLAKMYPEIIKSRDNMDLVSYLSIPVWDDNNGKTDKPLPMVINVHGGPWARDEWGYNPQSQWLANRGYAVLNVNYRSSTGFGKKFINAGDKEWAGKMHDDLIDAVNWAIKEKIADPKKIAIMGGSYGGYATLVGLTFTPDVFAAGVDIVGPSNLITLMNNVPPYWMPQMALLKQRVGDYTTPEGQAFLKERSPLTFVDKIKKPLLIGQGANDPRVKQSESDQIVKLMQKKKIPVTYLLYSDEGHGFVKPENQFSFYAVAESFLVNNLGGRSEPIGNSFKNSSIAFPAGKEYIPGLKELSSNVK